MFAGAVALGIFQVQLSAMWLTMKTVATLVADFVAGVRKRFIAAPQANQTGMMNLCRWC